ncbi:hypothetical protein CDD81_5680 [Ophiocordyceps australis]|uniref:Glycosyl transferase CAP10 domain-containing protein n=1 Tax=Ophiocordyceps australis TaxID=1399860 RepID=A0A2C5XI88_9HYPO|nr:hypothetical protein CDD81_5680 [Ophiocordyceps australis]
MRRRQYTVFGALVFILICAYSLLGLSSHGPQLQTGDGPETKTPSPPVQAGQTQAEAHSAQPPDEPLASTMVKSESKSGSHPIEQLLNDARHDFAAMRARQSSTLADAVREYRSRYGLPPPPNFDKWFNFAKSNNVQLTDEFDTMHTLMTPFWGLKPQTIRHRAREALGLDNALLGVAIRNGEVRLVDGGPEWQRNATKLMMAKFAKHLPDMDLAFNIHDEPRVVLPHDDLARLVHQAKAVSMPAARAVEQPANAFSPPPPDLGDGKSFAEAKTTRFNTFAHQATWTHSRMSCPPDSPARALEDDEPVDDLAKCCRSEFGFIYNLTAMSDICLSPSLSSTYGFFDRPNAYSIVHDLMPIFSQSKISSYSDIIYPSPWYWDERVPYHEDRDRPWADKMNKLYWRGSTTGGFSRNGGWRRQHRQHFVKKMNARDQALITQVRPNDAMWEVLEVPRGDYRDLIDVSFSHVGQCDPGDCEAQIQFFDVKEHVEQQDAWAYRFLLDIDGNAFSGRFYAFLKSWSLTFKLAMFGEWHAEWLRPWVHYVPLSLQGNEWLEAVRFFATSPSGSKQAERMAVESRDWANKVVRKEDMEAWFFRLLLEYARVIDDHRETIGYGTAGTNKGLTKQSV